MQSRMNVHFLLHFLEYVFLCSGLFKHFLFYGEVDFSYVIFMFFFLNFDMPLNLYGA